eukprot:5426160-Pyramimonas_sp.AAC.1
MRGCPHWRQRQRGGPAGFPPRLPPAHGRLLRTPGRASRQRRLLPRAHPAAGRQGHRAPRGTRRTRERPGCAPLAATMRWVLQTQLLGAGCPAHRANRSADCPRQR